MVDTPDAVAFCRGIQPRLLGALTLQCGDAAVAEELTQETLAVVWDKWARVRRMDSPEAWALRVGYNLSKSWIRRRIAERRALHRALTPPADVHLPERVDVRDGITRLPARQRAAIVLRFYSDLSIAQTAGVMGCAPGTVKALTHQGIEALRRELAPSPEETSHGR